MHMMVSIIISFAENRYLSSIDGTIDFFLNSFIDEYFHIRFSNDESNAREKIALRNVKKQIKVCNCLTFKDFGQTF